MTAPLPRAASPINAWPTANLPPPWGGIASSTAGPSGSAQRTGLSHPLAPRAVNTSSTTPQAVDVKGGGSALSLARAKEALNRSASVTRPRGGSAPRDARLDVNALVDEALYVDFSGSRASRR